MLAHYKMILWEYDSDLISHSLLSTTSSIHFNKNNRINNLNIIFFSYLITRDATYRLHPILLANLISKIRNSKFYFKNLIWGRAFKKVINILSLGSVRCLNFESHLNIQYVYKPLMSRDATYSSHLFQSSFLWRN